MWKWLKKQYRNETFISQLLNFFFGGITAGLISGIAEHFPSEWLAMREFIRAHVTDVLFQFLFAMFILALATAGYALRSRHRGIYASLEILFGIVAGVYAANQFYGAPSPDFRNEGYLCNCCLCLHHHRGLDNWYARNSA